MPMVRVRSSEWQCIGGAMIEENCSVGIFPDTPICLHCNQGGANGLDQIDDMKYDDHVNTKPGNYPKPKLSSKTKRVAGAVYTNNDPNDPDMYKKSDSQLLKILKDEMIDVSKSKDVVLKIIDYFMKHDKNKAPLVHEGNMPLAKAARAHQETKDALNKIKTLIRKTFAGKRRSVAPVKYFFPQIDPGYVAYENFYAKYWSTSDEDSMLAAVIGGTKCCKIFVRNLTETKTGLRFDLRLEIKDHFGVDQTDLYTEALCAFWLLQHARRGPKPFVNIIVVQETVNLNLWTDPGCRAGVPYRNRIRTS
jgi:hypothetical protein